jgi:plastocyanin
MNTRRRQLLLGVTASFGTGLAFGGDEPAVVPVGEDGVQRLTIEMDNYSYAPAHIVVQAGKPVELTFVSVSDWTPHDFVIDDPAFGQEVDVNVGGGKTRAVTFTPANAGTFVFYCSKDIPFAKGHREKGMEGRIEVRTATSETP